MSSTTREECLYDSEQTGNTTKVLTNEDASRMHELSIKEEPQDDHSLNGADIANDKVHLKQDYAYDSGANVAHFMSMTPGNVKEESGHGYVNSQMFGSGVEPGCLVESHYQIMPFDLHGIPVTPKHTQYWSVRESNIAIGAQKMEGTLNDQLMHTTGDVKIFKDFKERNYKFESPKKKKDWKRVVKCDLCDKMFRNLHNMNCHRRTHFCNKTCSVCNRNFRSNYDLKMHSLSHTGEKAYSCEICQKRFMHEKSLRRHKCSCLTEESDTQRKEGSSLSTKKQNDSESPEQGRKFLKKAVKCDLCDKTFRNRHYMSLHRRVHFTNKTCFLCNRTFRNEYDLKLHMLSHTGEKPFSCETCKKRFVHEKSLRRHKCSCLAESGKGESQPTKELKHYSCGVCKKLFGNQNDLIIHEQVHTDNTSFVCFVCNQIFSHEYLLKRHLETQHHASVDQTAIQTPHTTTTTDAKTKDPKLNMSVDSEANERWLRSNEKHNVPSYYQVNKVHKGQQKNIQQQPSVKNNQFAVLKFGKKPKLKFTGIKLKEGFSCVFCRITFSNARALKNHMRAHILRRYAKVSTKRKVSAKFFNQQRGCGATSRRDTEYNLADNFTCFICQKHFLQQFSLDRHLNLHQSAGKKLHVCDMCERSFSCSRSLHIHQSTHALVKARTCSFCQKGFTTTYALNQHKKQHGGQNKYYCQYCGKGFVWRLSWQEHERSHTGEKSFVCETCGKGFARLAACRNHQAVHSKEKQYACSMCPQRFNWKNSLKVHENKHLGIKPHVCDICNKAYARSHTLVVHKRLHTGEKPYECKNCGKKFRGRKYLNKHMQVHNEEIRDICPVCGKTFVNQNSLRRHIIIHSSSEQFKCEVCEKRFCRQSSLKQHMERHSNDKPYMCERCGKGFKEAYLLRIHQSYHTGERPLKCQLCDKIYQSHAGFKRHKMMHEGVKPYVCSVCYKSFYESKALKIHMRLHTGEKPYNCTHCEKKFSTVTEMKKHQRTHTGEKPYVCEMCGKTFTWRSALKSHLRNHTGECPYKCERCQRDFKFSSALRHHQNKCMF